MSEASFTVRKCSTQAADGRTRCRVMVLSLGLIALAAALRICASYNDFWFDEIWSWKFATETKSLWQIATRIRHDNNHILNTWILHLLPPDSSPFLFRLPAVIASVGTVVLAGLCGFRRSLREGLLATLLTGGSFVLIQYGSEARGYAYLLFFLLFCIWLMEKESESPSVLREWLFAVSASFGILSHFSFAFALFGFMAWSVCNLRLKSLSRLSRIRLLTAQYLLPLLILGGLLIFNRDLVVGGGNRPQLSRVLLHVGSLFVGGPDSGWLAAASCAGALITVCMAAALLARTDPGLICFCVGASSTLLLSIAITRHDLIYPRYFLIPFTCGLLLLSHLLAWLWGRQWCGRAICVIAVAAILTGNLLQAGQLIRVGRGGYRAAVDLMIEKSTMPQLTVGSDHDFRNQMVLRYYHQRSGSSKSLNYVRNGQWPAGGPEWVIMHSQGTLQNPPLEIPDANGNHYRFLRAFPYSGLSGWNWVVYHKQ